MSSQRFTAKIYKHGLNPCVDVPEAVSAAFRSHARSGRVSVEGTLNEAPIRAVLIPIADERHRLYVNGAMRRTAAVDVGDRVRLVLRPVADPRDVPIPPDVAGGLGQVKGAPAAFAALSPSHRRELIRYIDDAKTPESRRARILKAAEHALGKRVPSSSRMKMRPLWTCPECGNQFVNKNQFHSCKSYRLEHLFEGKPPGIRNLFDRFREMVEACGPVTIVPYRDKVGLMVRVRFAGATPRARWLDIGFWLPRRVEDRRFRRVETIYPNAHVHTLRVTRPEELDEQVVAWIKEAYAVGCQQHLAGRIDER